MTKMVNYTTLHLCLRIFQLTLILHFGFSLDHDSDINLDFSHYPLSPPKYHGHHDYKSEDKHKELTELFEVALTALAYLSFGIFAVHIIMCISAVVSIKQSEIFGI